MKNTLLILLTLITLCSFAYKAKKMQRRQGVLIHTDKGYEFVPMEDWQNYTPKQFDTCFQYRMI